jgi:hypothetical protein
MSDTAFEDPLLPLTAEDITALFTRADGQFLFARWGRPIAPVVFGVEDATVSILKGAIEAVVALAGHKMAETDPELGANLMVFFIRDWSELSATPGLDRLLPDLPDLVARLEEADANQYRAFRFETDGAIKAAFVFVRMDAHLPGSRPRPSPSARWCRRSCSGRTRRFWTPRRLPSWPRVAQRS